MAKSTRGGGLDRLLAVALLVAVAFGIWKFSKPHKNASKPAKSATVVVETKKVRVTIPAAQNAAVANALANPPSAPAVVSLPSGAVKSDDSGVPITPLPPPTVASPVVRRTRDILEAQVVLARQGISCGSLDGVIGSQTRAAIRAFQRKMSLPETGRLDTNTRTAVLIDSPALTAYTITSNDLSRLQPLSKTWLGKSQQSAMDYETVLELVAEKSHAHPALIRQLNPGVNWSNVVANAVVTVPDVTYPAPKSKAAFVLISLSEKTLEAFDVDTNLLAHFPCSIAQRVEKRPVGELQVTAIAPNPNYTFNPEIFPEVPEAHTISNKLILQPGANNPVGTVWISLDRPGYGIHGTPKPEDVGRTESHGCFRLANWNAEYLLKLVWVGMPVRINP